jgi:hypothetical protein
MRKQILAALFFCFVASQAFAQTTPVVLPNGCGTGNPGSPSLGYLTVDSTLRLCAQTSGSGTFPAASTPVAGNASGTTGAVVGTLAGTIGKTTYLCDFDVAAIGGTAAIGPITVTGLAGGTKTYQMTSSATGSLLSKSFSPCIPASAANTAIVITTTADGTATTVNVNSDGYQQ